ncbi:MAG TPA: HNH endonuclease domain-containing protein [Terracidiphilus sp.]
MLRQCETAIAPPSYSLGLELGASTVGWALIELDAFGSPIGLIRTGVRVFAPGVDGAQSEIEAGRDRPSSWARKIARTNRRLLRRRAYRKQRLFELLQESGLLPRTNGAESIPHAIERHTILLELDRSLFQKWRLTEYGSRFDERPMYVLRRLALDVVLQPYEIGRILFHLCQRRGFRSNAKERSKRSYGRIGPVHAGVDEWRRCLEEVQARTVGEYFCEIGVHPLNERVRGRWLAREMLEQEFEAIWRKQTIYHPELLTAELYRKIRHTLLVDRPNRKGTLQVGSCELEGGNHRRAPWATLEANRMRLLESIGHLRIVDWETQEFFAVSQQQREALYELLDQRGNLSLDQLRKGLKLRPHLRLYNDRAGQKKVPGNRINQIMISAFGPRWGLFSEQEQTQIVDEWRTIPSEKSLIRRGVETWGLDQTSATRWAHSVPETGYCKFSRKAIRKLMPLQLKGYRFEEAVNTIYGDRKNDADVLESLPPLEVHSNLAQAARNRRLLQRIGLDHIVVPGLERTLTEMRKLVNSLIREYGMPNEIHFELRRELKMYRIERLALETKIKMRERSRRRAEARLAQECGILKPSREQLEIALLFVECGGVCPYSGKAIPFPDLFSEMPRFRLQHIIPRHLFPDESFQNKVVCWTAGQEDSSRPLTPFERFGASREQWTELVHRVETWKPGNPNKLHRIMIRSEEQLQEFIAMQISDLRQASVQTARYLGLLYGHITQGQPRVFANTGVLTATLRRTWRLDFFSRDRELDETSSVRIDYRRHAMNAIITALTRHALRVVQACSRSAPTPNALPLPWKGFVTDVSTEMKRILVSHRPDHKLAGEMHDESFYSPPYLENGSSFVHVRKPVSKLSPKEIADIVDPIIRRAVLEKAQSLHGDLSRCERDQDWPMQIEKSGKSRPIKRVRVRKSLRVKEIGSGERRRYVAAKGKHHVSVFAVGSAEREAKWVFKPVSLFEAMERKKEGKTIVEKTDREVPEMRFKFSLMGGDTVEAHRGCFHDLGSCRPEVFVVRTIQGNGQLGLVEIANAQTWRENVATKKWLLVRAEGLRKLDCRKVRVDVLGRIHPAND